MDNNKTFHAVTDEVLFSLISEAHKRVVFIAPGVRGAVADALISAAQRLPRNVSVILDVDPEICRLGYGEIDALKKLQEFHYSEPNLYAEPNFLLAQPGVRIGVLIVDDDTLFYSPTPLLIEAGPTKQSNSSQASLKPNGIMIRAGVPPSLAKVCAPNADSSTREIGHKNVKDLDIEKAAASLKECPPRNLILRGKSGSLARSFVLWSWRLQITKLHPKQSSLIPPFLCSIRIRKRSFLIASRLLMRNSFLRMWNMCNLMVGGYLFRWSQWKKRLRIYARSI